MKDRHWSEYWEKDGAESGEVFISGQGDRHPALAEFWRAVFADLSAGARVVDVACGAGSIYAHLAAGHGFELHATDIAAEALAALSERIDGVTTAAASADDLPYDDASFDLVVSQFGMEYAGLDAFKEAARIVRDGGRLVALAHIQNGYVDSNNKAQLKAAEVARKTRFIELARDLTETAFKKGGKALAKRENRFVPAIKELAATQRYCKRGVHAHLFVGFRQLYENRQQYDLADITGWLDGMQGELDKSIDRLTRMRAAALSDNEIGSLRTMLESAGLNDISIKEFMTPGNELPVAWELVAKRAK